MTDAEFSMVVLHEGARGYSADAAAYVSHPDHGCCIASCWRNTKDRRLWNVIAYGSERAAWDGARAVMDDFGNLRRVPA